MKPKTLPPNSVSVLQARLSDEYAAYYHYNALGNWCKNVGYNKAAEFFLSESADELTHAKKIENYLIDWNVIPDMPEIMQPKTVFKSLVEGIEDSYSLEWNLYEDYEKDGMKMMASDLCTFNLIQELLNIQVKSVAEYSDKLNMLEGVDTSKTNLLLLEKKLF